MPTRDTPHHCLIRCAEVERRVGLSRWTIRRLVAAGDFPVPVPVVPGGGAVGWVEAEVDRWVAARIAARDGRAA